MEQSTHRQAEQHAINCFPRESCGLVIMTEEGERYVPCRNIAKTASEHFIIPPEDYANAADTGTITAIVHSHPNTAPRPSQGDLVSCEKSGLPWLIIAVWQEHGDKAPRIVADHMFVPGGYEAPLVGREFCFGVMDCYTLIRDWYKRERGITLKDFERRDNFWLPGNEVDLYAQYEQAGFKDIGSAPIEVGDVILMQIRAPFANHAGVYIGNEQIIQHLYGRLSTRDIYGGYWREVTRRVIRYG